METYLKRTYGQKKPVGEQKSFPFWDYRSRRGSLSTSASCSDGSSVSSMSSSRSDVESESVSLSGSDSDSLQQNDPTKLTLQFFADPHEVFPLLDLYQPIVAWIDSDLQLFKITERTANTNRDESVSEDIPSLAIIVFLHEEGMVGCERIQSARRHFDKTPWKFHHSEQLGKGKINPYPYNSQEFYYTSQDLPLWAVRQVHYGKEHIRLVVYTSDQNWEDMLDFYKLILGMDPELQRNDFCLFTIHAQIHYNVQFALKRLPANVRPMQLSSVTLQFKVTEVGHLVPLFPNICRPVQDNRWETTDHDGNSILLDVTGPSHNSSLDKSFSRLSTYDSVLDRSHGQVSVCSSSSSGVYSSSNSAPERPRSRKEHSYRKEYRKEQIYKHNDHYDATYCENDRFDRDASNRSSSSSEHSERHYDKTVGTHGRIQRCDVSNIRSRNDNTDTADIRTKLNNILQRSNQRSPYSDTNTQILKTEPELKRTEPQGFYV